MLLRVNGVALQPLSTLFQSGKGGTAQGVVNCATQLESTVKS